MHIAFLTPEFPHPEVAHAAGIGTSVKNLTIALKNENIKVTVFVYGQKRQEVLKEDGIVIHLIKNKKYKLLGWFFHRKHMQNYINSVIEKEKIDLIEAPDWTGIVAFMNLDVPIVIRFHGSDAYFCHLENRKQKIKNFWFEKLAIKRAQAFIAPTTFAGEVSKRLFKIIGKKIETIYNGVDLKEFENKEPEKIEKNTILYIGTLIRKKGVLELPEIFKKVRNHIPEAKLVLIGADSFDIKTNSTSTWQLMKNQLTEDDLKNVTYLGKIPYKEVNNYIKKANVCVFPTFAETFGMVTIESMAMQKAIVNSDIGWSQELIIDEISGFLVHPENHNLYSDRIIQLLQNDSLCLEMGKKARIRVEAKFDINTLVKENLEFYQKIINHKI
ncbi:glycosyltransferase family 4 protein [Flavobacterium tyrosinilyticum]|uniref:glycosyltransferase family 4 protein n=1 Tax=Flavobacterium tyrosinilyticum TaxID=1658740 RepID=UPI00202FCC87|nr:glycosyltransferase family 4 protein [Flavobacterium tyrosinilyticum]MCM0668627.1 glycosyltransferase family 4 protein [Flavobacterium tyrosinilyticum]